MQVSGMRKVRPVSDLADAIKRAIKGSGLTYPKVAEHLADHDIVTTKDTISLWANGNQRPWPEEVFALERILDLRGGTLSRTDGYLPVDAKPTRSVLEAIDADNGLTPTKRRYLRRLYRDMLADDE